MPSSGFRLFFQNPGMQKAHGHLVPETDLRRLFSDLFLTLLNHKGDYWKTRQLLGVLHLLQEGLSKQLVFNRCSGIEQRMPSSLLRAQM